MNCSRAIPAKSAADLWDAKAALHLVMEYLEIHKRHVLSLLTVDVGLILLNVEKVIRGLLD
jgi:hypothetical protein